MVIEVLIMWARIENGVVVELTNSDPAGRFHPDLMWRPCPPGTERDWTFDGEGFSPPVTDILTLYALKVKEVSGAAQVAVAGGFWSSALGAPYLYGSQTDDQLSLSGSVVRGIDAPYLCRDQLGVKAYRLHSVQQLEQVAADFALHRANQERRADVLQQQLDGCLRDGDQDTMRAVRWSMTA